MKKILNEDCYVEVASRDALPGDVILYLDEMGDPEHSGIVVSQPTVTAESIVQPTMVVSKWGMWREVIHSVGDCPYYAMNTKYYRVTE